MGGQGRLLALRDVPPWRKGTLVGRGLPLDMCSMAIIQLISNKMGHVT